ncbi:conserved hypothetical protein [Candidatus Brocadia pituitae]|nr:conserved hypothetical protein [Candidatus Brocadia pituitae]
MKSDKSHNGYEDALPKEGGTAWGSNKRITLSSTTLCPLENGIIGYRTAVEYESDSFRSALASSSGSPELVTAASSASFSQAEEYRFNR